MGFDIDEAIDDQNWKKELSVSLRFTSENDLDEIFNLIQTVGKEMECKDNELFAYSKNPATYLQICLLQICNMYNFSRQCSIFKVCGKQWL